MDSTEPPSGSSKKCLAEYQKALRRAEKERVRLLKEQEQEQERQKKLEEKTTRLLERQAKKDEEERIKEKRRQKRREEQQKREEEKEAERKRKEDDRRKKEEERIQKEQEKKKEEDFRIKLEEKQRAVLLGFLVKGEQKKEVPSTVQISCGPFMQFQLRKDMRMAPLHRVSPSDLTSKRANLDTLLRGWSDLGPADIASSLGLVKFGRANYLHELRTMQHTPLTYPPTWPVDPPDVQLLGDDGLCSTITSPTLKYHGSRGHGGTVWLRAKLFQFVENYRPAYYGTWRRRSRVVSGRRPFVRDTCQLDYSVDSDDEWEEEEPGESITQSENEEEEEKEEEEEEDDDQFFVPHGYLSDDEGVAVDDAVEDDDRAEEMKCLRRRLSVAEYEMAHRRGLQRLKPVVLGPIWLSNPVEVDLMLNAPTVELDEDKENIENFPVPEKETIPNILSSLSMYRAYLWGNTVPIPMRFDAPATPINRRAKRELPEEAVPYLIHLVHKSSLGKPKLAFEFRVFWHQRTTGTLPDCVQYAEFKRQNIAAFKSRSSLRKGPVLCGPIWDSLALSQSLVLSKLSEIAIFEDGRWLVHPEVICRFKSRLVDVCGMTELSIPNPSAEDTSLHMANFPLWNYLTDVATLGKKPKRLSATIRRSMDAAISVDSSVTMKYAADSGPSQANPITTMVDSSPRVVIQALTDGTAFPTSAHKLDVSESKESSLPTGPSPLLPILKDSISPTRTDFTKSPKITTPTTHRKRVTLETFFSPPSKRPHSSSTTEAVSSADPIIIDSD